jgi:hopanoid biosynthesis associated RND transporter like protein HpnN
MAVAALLALGSLALLPKLRFDFDPLNLKDPRAESVATLHELMDDPTTTPYTLNVLVPSVRELPAMAGRLAAVAEVEQTISALSFVPDEQEAKLAIIADAALILGPTLAVPAKAPAASPEATRKAVAETAAALRRLAGDDGVARHAVETLERVAAADAAGLARVEQALVGGLPAELEALSRSLEAGGVTLDSLPDSIKRDWVAADGRARIEVYPKGDMRTNAGLERFVAAVRPIAPEATGTPILIQESGETVVGAFRTAGWLATVAIAVLLLLVLRRPRDVLLVLAPLFLAGLLTLATGAAFDLPLNFANVITLPLLLGIGVAFDVYFILNWRAGMARPLASATARAVLFSAGTTTVAFGGLALSHHVGTSEMGILLTMGLAYTVAATFLVLPALLGPPPARTDGPA